MKCPVCQVDLKIAERAGIEIDYCPNCRGVWLDRGELDKIIERYAQSSPADAPSPRTRSAPPPARPYPEPPSYDDDAPYPREHPRRRKRNWLEDLFDVFD
ncbi:MAG: zf-TFIIB domain-containing protein [Fimbriimonadales bacterium]|nr:zf-TFIIB domain-containing protein [Fimbriimonadales bacterium]